MKFFQDTGYRIQDTIQQRGQIALITLLVLTVATTVALSFISRTSTDVAITNQIEESAKAFSAAEAGIEEALKSGAGTGVQVLSSGTQYQVTVADIGGGAGVFEFPKKTTQGNTETLWLVNHNIDGTLNETPTFTGNLQICWIQESPSPAMAATILYKRLGNYYVAKSAYDSDVTRRATNNFIAPSGQDGCGKTGNYYQAVNFLTDFGIDPISDVLLMLRLRPIYSDASFIVDPLGGILPLQGKRIESVGNTPSGITRKISVFQQYRSPSTIFDYALYSQGNLVK